MKTKSNVVISLQKVHCLSTLYTARMYLFFCRIHSKCQFLKDPSTKKCTPHQPYVVQFIHIFVRFSCGSPDVGQFPSRKLMTCWKSWPKRRGNWYEGSIGSPLIHQFHTKINKHLKGFFGSHNLEQLYC